MMYRVSTSMADMKTEVVETQTGNVIYTFVHDDYLDTRGAKALCNHLNMGGGFAGNTPSFFMNRLEIQDAHRAE